MSDDWNHRSQFLDVKGEKSRCVSDAVNRRKVGDEMSPNEIRRYLRRAESDDNDTQESRDAGDWEDRFDRRHCPERYADRQQSDTDERSNRERLLAGETV